MKNANIIFHRITLMDSYSTDYYDISYPGLIMKVLLAKYFQHLRKLFLPNYSSSTWPASLPTTWCRHTSPPPSSSSLPGSRFLSPLSPCLEGYIIWFLLTYIIINVFYVLGGDGYDNLANAYCHVQLSKFKALTFISLRIFEACFLSDINWAY